MPLATSAPTAGLRTVALRGFAGLFTAMAVLALGEWIAAGGPALGGPPAGRSWSAFDPISDRHLWLVASLWAAAGGVVVSLYAWRPSVPRGGCGSLATLARQSNGRLAIALVLTAQALDVLTSILGYRRGFTEGMPMTRSLVEAVGPAGFVLAKLLVVSLVALVIPAIPLRLGVLLIAAGGALTLIVGIHNLMVLGA